MIKAAFLRLWVILCEVILDERGGGQPSPFVNAFDHPQAGSLRYNTSQAGMAIPICYGTQRVSVNLLEFFDFKSTGGSGKGGKGLGGGGGKKGQANTQYSVNVAFGACIGPVSTTGASHGIAGNNRIWANGSIAAGLANVGLNGYTGNDGQTPDPVFVSIDINTPVLGYSGLAYVTGTPLQLGASPALPNISFEISGFASHLSNTGSYQDDANPSTITSDLLSNARYGAGFPSANIDSTSFADWAIYCRASQFCFSLLLDKSQPAARWMEELFMLTVTAPVWSGSSLKAIPYGDAAITANGATWTPNLTWQYSFTDADFISDTNTDPVEITRLDPSQVVNWLALEYMDSANSFNPNLVTAFDQGIIDQFGIKVDPSVQAHEITNPTTAQLVANLLLQRKAYVRNTYKFRVGWRFSLLEPMDIVLLTDSTCGLNGAAVRITEIEENDNGELTITAEEIPGVTP